MKKKLIPIILAGTFSLALSSCGGFTGTYDDYDKDFKNKIVTNISKIEDDDVNSDTTYSVEYFTKTVEFPVETVQVTKEVTEPTTTEDTETTEDGTTSEEPEVTEKNIRKSYTLTYKINDGYRLTEYTTDLDTEEKVMTSDVLYDIDHATVEEVDNELVYYVNKYTYDPVDGLYSLVGEKNIFIEDTPVEEQVYGQLWKDLFIDDEKLGLVNQAKQDFYSEVLDYGDINDVDYDDFRSLSTGIMSAKLEYNSNVDGHHVLSVGLTNNDVFDLNWDNFANLFTKNKWFIEDVTIDGRLGLHAEYDLKAIFVEDNDSVFSHEVKELTAPAADQLKPITAE